MQRYIVRKVVEHSIQNWNYIHELERTYSRKLPVEDEIVSQGWTATCIRQLAVMSDLAYHGLLVVINCAHVHMYMYACN